jgi:hypothetical protein
LDFTLIALAQAGPSWNTLNSVYGAATFTPEANPLHYAPHCDFNAEVAGNVQTHLTWNTAD